MSIANTNRSVFAERVASKVSNNAMRFDRYGREVARSIDYSNPSPRDLEEMDRVQLRDAEVDELTRLGKAVRLSMRSYGVTGQKLWQRMLNNLGEFPMLCTRKIIPLAS